METQAQGADQQVLAAAIRLFSQLGYDATTVSQIAEAAGEPIEHSPLLQAGKQQLYRAVLAHFYERETARLQAAAQQAPQGIEGLHLLADALLDFMVEHPEAPALWWHRVLKDAADLRFPEEEFFPPLAEIIKDRDRWGIAPGLDPAFVGWVIIWSVSGFLNGGLPDDARHSRHADRPEALRLFRTQLHTLVDRLS